MNLSKEDLQWAASQALISPEEAEALWKALETRRLSRPRFDLAHVAFYLGALTVIAAMGVFLTEAWEQLGGGGIFLVSFGYALVFGLAGLFLWYRSSLKTPGALLVTVAVCMTPPAIYGLERYMGFWLQGSPEMYRDFHVWIRGSWFLMELGTVIVGLVAILLVRFPFLTAPIAFSLWYMSMDVVPLLYGRDFTDERLIVSVWFGLGMLLVAYLIDRRTEEDFAFWTYLFGLLAFWGGLSFMSSDGKFGRHMYGLINVGLILVSVFLERRTFIVFGGLGVYGYLAYLAYEVFKDSLMFPIALSAIGVLIIFLGIQYQRHANLLSQMAARLLPEQLRRLRPRERARV